MASLLDRFDPLIRYSYSETPAARPAGKKLTLMPETNFPPSPKAQKKPGENPPNLKTPG